jgi:DNA-binding winged helix-turn-helix (wHTH) protein
LSRDSEPVHIEPQVFDLLLHLIQNRDHVVSKDDRCRPSGGDGSSQSRR